MTDMEERARRVKAVAEQFDSGGALIRRWLGCWIDFLGALLTGVIVMIPFFLVGRASNSDQMAAIAVLVGCLGVVGYYWVGEAVWGRTLGKLVTGLVVVNKYGNSPGFGLALVRTLFRLIEVNPFLIGGLPAGIFVLATKRRQRLGDLVANTYVLPASDLKGLDAPAAVFT